MSRNRTPLPPELNAFLRDEADEADAGASLSAVWRLLDSVDGDTNARDRFSNAAPDGTPDPMDVDAAWHAVRQRAFGNGAPETFEENHAENHHPPPQTSPEAGRRSGDHTSADHTSAGRTAKGRTAKDRRAAPRPAAQRSRRTRTNLSLWIGTAATLLIVLFGAYAWWTQPVSVTAPAGAQVTATLPDGSTVQLNSGTTLTYPRGFSTLPGRAAPSRSVTLDGEAYFSVTHGERPFTVQTFNSRIEVLGTEFNVRARETDDGVTDVVVASGRVRVQRKAARAPEGVVLSEPGQRSRVATSVTASSVTDVSRTLAWRSRGFAVTDQPLSVVVRELERRFDLTLDLSDEAQAQGGSLSLYYARAVDAETIIHDLCTARGLSYRPTARGFSIYLDAGR